MQLSGNTILITGGGTGIGRGLAEAFHARGNQVLIAGRRREALDATTRANPGMAAYPVDLAEPQALRAFAAQVLQDFPGLNVLINNAGIMRPEQVLAQPPGLDDLEAIVATNLLAPLRLTAALVPHLHRQPRATLMNVTSGLAFVPLAYTPTYCATKAALHSYTESLRYQLRDSAIQVLELIPPYVATDLMNGASDPRAMPLAAYLAEVMALLEAQPEAPEICVEAVKRLRSAAPSGHYDAVFKGFNDAMAANPH